MSERPADPPTSSPATGVRRPFVGAAILAIGAVAAAVIGPAGTRAALWSAGSGMGLFRGAIPFALPAVLMAITDIRKHGRALTGLAIIAVAVAASLLPARAWIAALTTPPIHDVTTDLDNPPRYVALATLRVPPANPAEYGGDAVARQQRTAYADLRPLVMTVPPARALALAADTARAEGWTVVAQDIGFGDLGRLEATDTTVLFGRLDDIVVRVVPHPAGSRVDVRASARDDGADSGRNAARIRHFLAFLAERTATDPGGSPTP